MCFTKCKASILWQATYADQDCASFYKINRLQFFVIDHIVRIGSASGLKLVEILAQIPCG